MKKILIVLTNTTRYGNKAEATGLWLGEAVEFASRVEQAGFSVDYVSPKGGFVPLDPRSMKYADEEVLSFYEQADFQQRALTHSHKPADVVASDYVAIYYTGGHGVMWDFPDDVALQTISREIYEQGGYISSVCHGIAGLLNSKTSDGKYVIAGKRVTGFTAAEEVLSGKKSVVPFLNKEAVEAHGGIFDKARAFSSHVVVDGRLVTGQNPFSTKAVAEALLQQLQ